MPKFPPLDKLDKLISYDPATGLFLRSNGKVAGTARSNYPTIAIGGRSFLAHRLAWYIHYRREPIDQIDHINGVKNDNRIENLRELNAGQNVKSAKAGFNLRFFKDGKWI